MLSQCLLTRTTSTYVVFATRAKPNTHAETHAGPEKVNERRVYPGLSNLCRLPSGVWDLLQVIVRCRPIVACRIINILYRSHSTDDLAPLFPLQMGRYLNLRSLGIKSDRPTSLGFSSEAYGRIKVLQDTWDSLIRFLIVAMTYIDVAESRLRGGGLSSPLKIVVELTVILAALVSRDIHPSEHKNLDDVRMYTPVQSPAPS